VLRAALSAAWTARNPRERFTAEAAPAAPERIYYRAADGWEAPLWNHPPLPGASGEPVLLVHGLGTNPRAFDYDPERSLAQALRRAGFDVYLMEHRGDRHAVAPPGASGFDFDDIVTHDVPAALAAIRQRTGYGRTLWIGHAMGGQLLYAHLARGGRGDLGAGVALCAPARFRAPRSQARLAWMVQQLLPSDWSIPSRRLGQALAPSGTTPLTFDTDGPLARGLMVDAMADVHAGLIRQIAAWVAGGGLCDRHGRFSYLHGLQGVDLPLLCVGPDADPICPQEAAEAAVEMLSAAEWLPLSGGWGHLDPLVGRHAPRVVHEPVVAWCRRWRKSCWQERRL